MTFRFNDRPTASRIGVSETALPGPSVWTRLRRSDPAEPAIDTPSTVPVLQTPRLVLRGHRLDDFAPCAALWADPEVTRFISAAPATEEEAFARFLRFPGLWAVLGFGYWAIEARDTGRYIGHVGFADYRRAIVPPLDGPEIGWTLEAAAAGRGYATEAAGAALAWGDRALGGRATVCIVRPDHVRSIRVADKLGYRPAGLATYKGNTCAVFRRPPPEAGRSSTA